MSVLWGLAVAGVIPVATLPFNLLSAPPVIPVVLGVIFAGLAIGGAVYLLMANKRQEAQNQRVDGEFFSTKPGTGQQPVPGVALRDGKAPPAPDSAGEKKKVAESGSGVQVDDPSSASPRGR